MKDYLVTILTPLLSSPEVLHIDEVHDDLGILLSVHVSIEDISSVIGKEGVMAKSIRQIMRLYGARNKARVSVRFLEPPGSSFVKNSVTITTSETPVTINP